MKMFVLTMPVPEEGAHRAKQIRESLYNAFWKLSNFDILESLVDVPEGDGLVHVLIAREV